MPSQRAKYPEYCPPSGAVLQTVQLLCTELASDTHYLYNWPMAETFTFREYQYAQSNSQISLNIALHLVMH